MNRFVRFCRPVFAVSALALLSAQAGASTLTPYEEPPVFKASEILPPNLVKGPHHQVLEDILNDGYLNRYTIESEFGTFTGVTSAKLRKRIREINALALMKEIRLTKTYRESATEAGGDVLRGAKMFVTQPVETTKGAVSGVRKVFTRVGEHLFGSERSEAEDPRWKSIIGFSKTKREYAFDFGVDVYSSNQVLQDELDDMAWAGYSGGVSVAGLMTLVPGAVGVATSVTGGSRLMNEVYQTTAPVDLRRMNRDKLIKMGASEDITDLFIDNAVFTPRQQTDLVFALEDMDGVANRDIFVKFAVTTADQDVAFFRQRMAQMYAAYHQQVTPLARFVSLGSDAPVRSLGLAQAVDGRVVFHAPLDYLIWSEPMANVFTAIDAAAGQISNVAGKEIWLAGNLSPAARRNIEARGWKVVVDQEVPLLGDLEGAVERISYR